MIIITKQIYNHSIFCSFLIKNKYLTIPVILKTNPQGRCPYGEEEWRRRLTLIQERRFGSYEPDFLRRMTRIERDYTCDCEDEATKQMPRWRRRRRAKIEVWGLKLICRVEGRRRLKESCSSGEEKIRSETDRSCEVLNSWSVNLED